jgi:cardiolipin synthase
MYKANTNWLQRLKQFGAYFVVAVVDPSLSRGLNFGIDE